MDIDRIGHFLSRLSFRQAIWLYSLAFALHVMEEWPQFTHWANRHGSVRFTQADYNTIHFAGIAGAVLAAALVWFFPNKKVIFLLFTFALTPGLFFNTLFHAGATAITGDYCPGLITALTIYPPLFYLLSRAAFQEGLLYGLPALASFLIAAAFHTWEVGHNVFKAW